jgi:hypothetical protein
MLKQPLFMSMERDCVSELQPPTGLLFIPQMIYEYGVSRLSDIDKGNRKTRRKTFLSSLSTTNRTPTDPDASEVRDRRLIAFLMARPKTGFSHHCVSKA